MMRCLSPQEAEELLRQSDFAVVLEPKTSRQMLVLEAGVAGKQTRVAAKPPAQVAQLTHFIGAVNRWLPSNRRRLFWVDHWQLGGALHNTETLVLAARAGLDEKRSLEDAPGHLFDSHPYGETEALEIGDEHNRDVGVLVGLVTLMITEASDGWLIAEGGNDRVEFWGGSIVLHSAEASRLKAARELFRTFNCELWSSSGGLAAFASRFTQGLRA
jgi:hypothetical protein